MDRVTEETASPQVSASKRGRNNTTDPSIRASLRVSNDLMRVSLNRVS